MYIIARFERQPDSRVEFLALSVQGFLTSYQPNWRTWPTRQAAHQWLKYKPEAPTLERESVEGCTVMKAPLFEY